MQQQFWPGTVKGDRDGETYERREDYVRLNAQAAAVWHAMKDGRWRTLWWLADATGCPPQSVSARLRDLRKPRFGGHTVDRKRDKGGFFFYRLKPNPHVQMGDGTDAKA